MSNLSITLQYVFEQIYFQTNPQKLQNITICTPASSTTKTGRHDIADIVKSGVKTPKIKNQINKMLPP
jgi:hypothetical protein